MSQATKDQIANLERQKIMLEERLELSNSAIEMAYLDEEIYEIKDTIRKLTANNGRF
jgi:dimeric dUTPase (all-alpha-NTP-PPase superfamily)